MKHSAAMPSVYLTTTLQQLVRVALVLVTSVVLIVPA